MLPAQMFPWLDEDEDIVHIEGEEACRRYLEEQAKQPYVPKYERQPDPLEAEAFSFVMTAFAMPLNPLRDELVGTMPSMHSNTPLY